VPLRPRWFEWLRMMILVRLRLLMRVLLLYDRCLIRRLVLLLWRRKLLVRVRLRERPVDIR